MSLVLLLLLELFLSQSLLQELSNSFLLNIHRLISITTDRFARYIIRYWVPVRIKLISISIDVVLLCL